MQLLSGTSKLLASLPLQGYHSVAQRLVHTCSDCGNGVLVQGHCCLSAQVSGTAWTLWTRGGFVLDRTEHSWFPFKHLLKFLNCLLVGFSSKHFQVLLNRQPKPQKSDYWCLIGSSSFSVSKLLLCSWCHLCIWASVCTFCKGWDVFQTPFFECILSLYHQMPLPASHQGRIAEWMVAWHLNPLTHFDYPCSPLSRAWKLRDCLSSSARDKQSIAIHKLLQFLWLSLGQMHFSCDLNIQHTGFKREVFPGQSPPILYAHIC